MPIIIPGGGGTVSPEDLGARGEHDQANSYKIDQLVVKDGKLYAANDTILAGTVFAEGTTGATWREVSIDYTRVFDHNPALPYKAGETASVSGSFYRSKADIPAKAFDEADWDLLGSSDLGRYKGSYSSTAAYKSGDMVSYEGRLFTSNNDRTSGVWPTAPAVGSGADQWSEQGLCTRYTNASDYASGDVVFDSGSHLRPFVSFLRCESAHAAGDAHDAGKWVEINRSKFRGEYGAYPQVYEVGDIVTVGKFSFKANTQNGDWSVSGPIDLGEWDLLSYNAPTYGASSGNISAKPSSEGSSYFLWNGAGATATIEADTLTPQGYCGQMIIANENPENGDSLAVDAGSLDYSGPSSIPPGTSLFAIYNNLGSIVRGWLLGGADNAEAERVFATVSQTSHGFVTGQPVRYSSDGSKTIEAAYSEEGKEAQYVVTKVIDAGNFEMTKVGIAEVTGHGFTVGEVYWLPAAAGVAADTASDVQQAVFTVVDADHLDVVDRQAVVTAEGIVPETLAHARFTLSADSAASLVCPFDEGQGDTSVLVNSGGTITIPPGKYRIQAYATRHAANLDYELYDVTNNASLEKYTVLNNGTASNGNLFPYYLTVSNPTQIQVREGGNGTAIVWNGRQSGVDAGWDDAQPSFGCFLDIQQLPSSTIVNPEGLIPETLDYVSLSTDSNQHAAIQVTTIGSGYTSVDLDGSTITNTIDSNNLIDYANNCVTIKKAGYYEIIYSARFNNGTSDSIIRVDGQIAFGNDSAGSSENASINGIIYLTAGQQVEFANQYASAHSSYLQSPTITVKQLPLSTVVTAETRQYSTTEQATDRKWIDGKTIYEKVWTFDLGETADEAIIVPAAEMALMDTIIEKKAMGKGNAGNAYWNSDNEGGSAGGHVNNAGNGGNWAWRIYGDNSGNQRLTKNGYSTIGGVAPAHLILEYTKV